MSDLTSDYRVIGLQTIKMGQVLTQTAVTYMPGTMSTLGNLVPDSASLILDPETLTNFFTQGKSEIDCQVKTPGAKNIEFASREMGAAFMAAIMGGTATDATTYLAPQTAQVVNEKSFEVVTQPINGTEFTISIPRASVTAGGALRFGSSETGTINVSATIMQPASNFAPYKMKANAG